MKRVWIIGDAPLREEYSTICKAHGYSIAARPTKSITLVLELTNLSAGQKRRNLHRVEAAVTARATIISSSTTVTVAEQATWLKHPARLIGIGALPSLLGGTLIEFAASEEADAAARRAAEDFASSLGKGFAFVQDSVGLVMPRMLCALANEACFAMMEGVADRNDIDTAMKLGTNYPHGPLEWAERIGWDHVLAVMSALHGSWGEDRYRPSPLMQRMAARAQGGR
jgi:3-hydroxybutyryl-CoA dehydrogenase